MRTVPQHCTTRVRAPRAQHRTLKLWSIVEYRRSLYSLPVSSLERLVRARHLVIQIGSKGEDTRRRGLGYGLGYTHAAAAMFLGTEVLGTVTSSVASSRHTLADLTPKYPTLATRTPGLKTHRTPFFRLHRKREFGLDVPRFSTAKRPSFPNKQIRACTWDASR